MNNKIVLNDSINTDERNDLRRSEITTLYGRDAFIEDLPATNH